MLRFCSGGCAAVFALATLMVLGPASIAVAQDGEGEDDAPVEAEAQADEAPDTEAPVDARDAEAQGLFSAAQSAFADGRFDNALEHFQRAFDLSDRPELLFNIGICADRLHQTDLAIGSFESFLERMPETDEREQVESRIAALREIQTEEEPDAREADRPGALPWALAISGGGLVVLGAVFVGVALAERSALEDIPEGAVWAEESGRHDLVPALSATGIVAMIVGGALVGTGLVWLLTGSSETESEVEPVVGLGYLGLRGRL